MLNTVLWFGSSVFPELSYVEGLIPSDSAIGRWQKLWDVGPSLRKQVIGGVPLKWILGLWLLPLPLCFLATMRLAALLHHVLLVMMFNLATGLTQWNQATMDWNLWNHKPNFNVLPPFKLIISGVLSQWQKSCTHGSLADFLITGMQTMTFLDWFFTHPPLLCLKRICLLYIPIASTQYLNTPSKPVSLGWLHGVPPPDWSSLKGSPRTKHEDTQESL